MPKPNLEKMLVPTLVVLLIVSAFVIGMLFTQVRTMEKSGVTAGTGSQVAGAGTGAAAAGQVPQLPPEGVDVDVDIKGAPRLGDKGAKVALVEFTDYQCPFCKRLYTDTFPQIKSDYIDTGMVQYIVRDFPLFQLHPQAQKAAEATLCANEQGKYWEYHDTLFENQQALQVADLKKYAADLGLNTGNFDNCLDSDKYADQVSASQKQGETYGVRGTPATFVGTISGNTVTGKIISGAVPYETFKAAIDAALGGA